jgi:hypothetical protein
MKVKAWQNARSAQVGMISKNSAHKWSGDNVMIDVKKKVIIDRQ